MGNLADARDLWERLEHGTANPFATWMFADIWWRHLGEERPLRLTAMHDGGEVAALLPLYEHGDALRLIGHGDADLLGPIGPPEQQGRGLRALRAVAVETGRRLIADELPAGSAAWLQGTVIRRMRSPVIDLPSEGFQALLGARSGNLRRGLGTRERRLARVHEVRVRCANHETLGDDLTTLMALHRARWSGTTEVFKGARVAMHHEFARRSLERGWLRLRLLELDGRPVAANYAFRVGNAEWYYQAGRDPAYARASVGHVLQAACIRAACEEGAREYRMLRGDEPYKFRWANRDEPVETVLVEAP